MKEEKARSLIQLSVDTSTNVLRAFCQKRLLCSHEQDLANFLDKNRHYFFHQFERENIRCCECSASVCDIAKENDIPQLEFSHVYQYCGNPVDGHTKQDGEKVIQKCLHAYKARNISVADLDIESLSVYLLHKGELSKIEIQWLNVIRCSVQRLNEVLLKPIFPLQLNWEDLKEAVVSLTCPHYYRPLVKSLFEIIGEEEKEEKKRTVPAPTIEQEHPSSGNKDVDIKDPKRTENTTLQDGKISQSNVPSIRNNTALTDYKSNKIHVETCKTVNVIRNFTLNVQYQKMVANADPQISSSFEQSELDVMWHFETPSNWKIGRIIRKLKNKSFEISSNKLIRIKRINKGSLNILTSVDFNVFSNSEAWESVCGVFLEKIAESFVVQSSRIRTYEIDVRVEIVHPDVSEKYAITNTRTILQIPFPEKGTMFSINHHVYAHTIYPGHFMCDGIYVDCIVDARLSEYPSKKGWWNFDYNLADLTTQFKIMLHLHRQIQEYENSEIPYQDFNEDIMDNIAQIRQGMTFPYKINDGMVCRFILSHMNEFDNNDMKGLSSALHEAVKCQASNNAKVIAWKLTRLFVKTLSKKQYYDIWPGFICVCKDESNTPPPFWFCSRHIAIVVEVFDIEDVNPRPSSFCDIPIAYRIVNGYSNEANLISKKIDQLDVRQNQLRTVKGVSNDIAEQLFASHSKLCLISSSLIKSKKYVKSNKSKPCGKSHVGYVEEPCIQLFCREKRIIPVGEAHFPRSINSVPTDVLEGYPRMLVQQVTIGSEVGPQNGRTGTLGGFVKFHGKDAFLTCAHVIVDRKYLVSNANRGDIHENPILVYCKLPGGGEFPCGKLVSYVFPPDIYEGSSVDAAIIKLKSASIGQIPIDTEGNSLPQEYLHKSFINYQEIGTMQDIQIVAVGAVSSIQQGTDKLHLESVKQVEFETLTQAVKSQFIQNPDIDITGRIHYRDVERILEDVEEGERRISRTVTLYNQISMRKLAFSPGDSGTCIYAKGPDGKFGCIGMAIASHPDGGCIITPIKPILSAFKLI